LTARRHRTEPVLIAMLVYFVICSISP